MIPPRVVNEGPPDPLRATNREPRVVDEPDPGDALRLVCTAARLMLEYNVRSAVLAREVARLGRAVGVSVEPAVAYRSVTLFFADRRAAFVQVPEYRLNVAVSAGVRRLIDRVVAGALPPRDAIDAMEALQRGGPAHGRAALLLLFGLAASALAVILRADGGAAAVAGVASALGLLARRQLGRRHWPLLSLPFVAGVVGGLLGGAAIRLGWTHTTGLCLVVPALMLVPGPHLINAAADLFENHVQTAAARFLLSGAILLAAAAGVLAGAWPVMGLRGVNAATSDAFRLTLALDVVLAGLASCGFGAFYNAPWRALSVSVACGMIGHGVRFVCLDASLGLPASTFLACCAIGVLAGAAAGRLHLPFPHVAFAGAVPMMPGTLIYRGIAGAARLAASGPGAGPADVAAMIVPSLQALLVVGAMAAGLFAGALAASLVMLAPRSPPA
jgi:uncharacterized membrane protein YjjP (DUF1212 family)